VLARADAPQAPVGLSEGEAVANIVKAVMGAGVFSLPWAVAQGGLLFVPAFILCAGALAIYTLSLLVDAKTRLLELRPDSGEQLSSYTGIVEGALGPAAGRLAEVLNLACCFGICSAYLVFVASTLATVFPGAGGQNALVWAITPAMVLLAWLRSMAGVSVMAAVGNASVAAGIAFTCWFSLQQPRQLAALPLAAPAGFASYFGSVAFLFFIHFTLPAIQSAMAAPQRFMPAVWKGFGLCAVVGAAFGALCAASFGPSVSSVVITHLGATPLSTAVKLLLCVNLLFTFPIVCRSAFLIVETLLQRARAGAPLGGLQQKALRTAFVLLASFVATSVPSFGQLLALVGGVSLSAISLVFPPLVLLLARDPAGGALLRRGAAERAAASLVAASGLAIMVFTVVTA